MSGTEGASRFDVASHFVAEYTDLQILQEVWRDDCYGLQEHFRQGDSLLDAGACFGAVSILAAHLGAARVLALEPSPRAFGMLQANLNAYAPAKAVVEACPAAIAAPSRHTRFFDENPDNIGGGSLYRSGRTPVACLTLRAAYRQLVEPLRGNGFARLWLKLDIEGAEREVFSRVNRATLQAFDYITMEWHNYDGEVYATLLEGLGFDILRLTGCGSDWDPTVSRGLLLAVHRGVK